MVIFILLYLKCANQVKKVALAQFEYINPLPKNTAEVLKRYKNIVVAEQNLGQFAGYLRMKIPGLNGSSVQ
jgi:2-oxoglutarate ferredoxin oxidoreductase subunit alpha